MRPPPPPRRIVPLLAAVAGVVVAHVLDYLVLFPQPGARAGHLDASGHAYWPVAVAVAAAAGALALIVAAAAGARRGLAARTEVGLGWLLAFQLAAFVAMEAGERAVVGLPPAVLLRSPEFWFGLALQLPVAWLARRLLGAVAEVAHRVAARRRPAFAAGRRPARSSTLSAVPRTAASSLRAQPRAPPPLLAFA